MRPEADRLHDPADRAGLDQLAGLDGRAVLEPLAVHDRVDAPGLRLHATHLGELLERGDARLVGHVVLAVLHHADAERRALVRDRPRSAPAGSHGRRALLSRCAPASTCGNRFRKAAARSGSLAKTDTSSPPPRTTASTWLLMCEWLMPMTANLMARAAGCACAAGVPLPQRQTRRDPRGIHADLRGWLLRHVSTLSIERLHGCDRAHAITVAANR